MVPVVNENVKLKLALAISTGTPITLANDTIETPPLVSEKTIKDFIKIVKSNNIFTKYFTH